MATKKPENPVVKNPPVDKNKAASTSAAATSATEPALAELAKKFAALQKAHDELQTSHKQHANEISNLRKELEGAKDGSEKILKLLSKKAPAAPEPIVTKEKKLTAPTGTFTVNGVTAKFRHALVNDGKGLNVPTAVVLENQEEYKALLTKLVRIKSGAIEIVEE